MFGVEPNKHTWHNCNDVLAPAPRPALKLCLGRETVLPLSKSNALPETMALLEDYSDLMHMLMSVTDNARYHDPRRTRTIDQDM
jgi:hypothetical protein